MHPLKYILTTVLAFTALLVSAQKPVVTKVPKFRPPTVKTFLGINQDSASVTQLEAKQLVAIPLRIVDDKNNLYPIVSYRFLYRRKGTVQNEETGKTEIVFTIVTDQFDASPLPKLWSENISETLKEGEQLYFFDILVKDSKGRVFFAPDLKITLL